ncbi:hypothetical protein J437_LFUL013302, partial [Ladona fulva]
MQSIYEAFRFTESYGVIFQCNVKYCLGPCEPVQCQYGLEMGESWGKRRRRRSSNAEDLENAEDMTLSQEILVLDFGDEKSERLRTPTIGGTPEADFGVVSVHCKDTRIAVQVRTNKPFNGRIYALGRSETCNVDVKSSDRFRLDLTMTGQDCNTRSVTGIYSNTVVLQHHSMVMTKADKIYKIKCTYDMSPKNITYGLIPIRDPEMISITSAPIAPAPRIRILDTRDREVETVRIGDKLTFRIEIPEDTPYGIFARSCVAMAKDSKSTFQIIDEE